MTGTTQKKHLISETRSSKYNSGRNFWRASTRLISWPGIILEKEQPCLDKGDPLSHPTNQRLPPTPLIPAHCGLESQWTHCHFLLCTSHHLAELQKVGYILSKTYFGKIVPKLNPFCQWKFEICKNHLFMGCFDETILNCVTHLRQPTTSSTTLEHFPKISRNVLDLDGRKYICAQPPKWQLAEAPKVKPKWKESHCPGCNGTLCCTSWTQDILPTTRHSVHVHLESEWYNCKRNFAIIAIIFQLKLSPFLMVFH